MVFDKNLESGLNKLKEMCDEKLHVIFNKGGSLSFSDYIEQHCDPKVKKDRLSESLKPLMRLFS